MDRIYIYIMLTEKMEGEAEMLDAEMKMKMARVASMVKSKLRALMKDTLVLIYFGG